MAKSDYYRLPHMLSIIIITPLMVLLTVLYYQPSSVPYGYLGPLGIFVKFLVDNPPLLPAVFYFGWGLHFGEAFYAVYLCSQKNLTSGATFKWFLSVLMYGIFSMYFLLKYKPQSSQAKRK